MGTRLGLWHTLADKAAEATVALSYGAPGYRLRARAWEPDALDVDLTGRVCLVTGANAGLGRATCEALAARGATVLMGCRSEARGAEARDALAAATGRDALHVEPVDVSSLASCAALARRLPERYGRLDVLVHNAGVMLPERRESVDGVELTFATNVLGGFALTRALRPLLEASAPARVVHVTSGGMYTQRLDLDDPFFERKPWDGVVAYAQTKRAQVILNELWAERLAGTGVTSNAMHPGWADTGGVRESLPRFWRLTRGLLRTPAQGADTAIWLAASPEAAGYSGQLFLDRVPRRTHVLPWTRSTDAERARLWALCEELAARAPAAPPRG